MTLLGQEVGEAEYRLMGLGLLLPAAIAAEAVAADSRPRWLGWRGALGLAAAVAAAYFALDLGPLRPSEPGTRWLPHLLVLAVPAGVIASRPRPWWLTASALGLTGAAAGPLLLADGMAMQALWGVALGYAVLFSGGAMLATNWSAPRLGVVLTANAAVAGFVVFQAAMTRLSFIAGALFAACAGATAIVCWARRLAEPALRAMVPGVVLLIVGFMFSAYLQSLGELPPALFAALALAPSVLFLRRVPVLGRKAPWVADAVAAVAYAAALAAVAARAALG